MDKKEYITNQLKRAVHKKYENYCITRIIHKLDRLDVQFITQQLFKRPDGKFAYSDLYFPQLNISVEIDESHHLTQKEADEQRTKDIISADKEIRKKYTGLEDVVLDPIKEYRIKASYLNTGENVITKLNGITVGTDTVKIQGGLIHITGDTKIDGNVISSGMIQSNAITTDKLNVSSLSSITATIGTLRTATTGARTEIKDNLIEVYDENNVLRVRMGVW